MTKPAAICFLLAALACGVHGEERPVALLFPGGAEGIPAQAMDQALAGFAEGLVKAGTWRIVDGKDIDLLLTAQEILLSGAFAESDAVRVGSLLSADLVVTLSAGTAGGGILLRARVLDPGSGEVKGSESLTAPADAVFTEASRLAFRLAGVPETAAGGGRGSLTVSADRDGAEVFLDGKAVGRTPLVLDPLPFGRYALEIRAGSLVYAAPLTVDGHERVHGTLLLSTGNLIVESDPPGALVRVGTVPYGSRRLIERIPAERQTVTLTLPGRYWRGVVPILAGKTVRVAVDLQPTASLRVEAAREVSSRLAGGEIVEEFSGGRTLDDLPPGAYLLVSSRPDRATGRREIVLSAGEEARVQVDLPLSPEAAARAASLGAERERLWGEDRALALPAEYLEGPIPDLGGMALGNTLLSFVPLGNALLLFPPAGMPGRFSAESGPVRAAHFGLGLSAQAGLAAALLIGEEPWRTTALAASAVLAAADAVLGAVCGLSWSEWTADMKARRAAHEEKARRIEELEALLAGYGP